MDDQPADHVPTTNELGLDDVVRFLRSSWKVGVAGAIVAGGVTAGIGLAQPRQWESSASLLVSASSFRSELKVDALPMQGYQRLLESAAVVEAARLKLRAAGILGADDRLEVGSALESRVLTTKRSEETVLAPLIELKARAGTPEAAVAIIDTWIACFLEHTRLLVSGSTVATTALVDSQYMEQRKHLDELEDRRLKAATSFKTQLADLQEKWNTTLATCRAESGDLLTKYQNETATLLSAARAEKKISQRQAEVDALTKSLADLKNQLSMAAVFKAMGQDQPSAADASSSAVYERLRDKERQLTAQLAITQSDLARDTLAIDCMQRTRENAYATLADQRKSLLDSLTGRQQAALLTLGREETSQLDRLDQELLPLRELVGKLVRSTGQAQIAKAQQSIPDVQVASAAVKPETPLPRGIGSKAMMAAVLGALAALALVLVRNINRRVTGKGA